MWSTKIASHSWTRKKDMLSVKWCDKIKHLNSNINAWHTKSLRMWLIEWNPWYFRMWLYLVCICNLHKQLSRFRIRIFIGMATPQLKKKKSLSMNTNKLQIQVKNRSQRNSWLTAWERACSKLSWSRTHWRFEWPYNHNWIRRED